MVECRWLKPVLVGQFEFVEWTGENHLRHSRFIALRDDKKAKDVRREAVTGGYIEGQINGYIIGPIMAFRKYIFSDVIPAFGNLDERADEVDEQYYDKSGSQPAWNNVDVDMASVAEAADDKSLSWYQMMTSLRQSMLNLLAAGLFHLTEQQLAMVCRDGGFTMGPPKDTQLGEVKRWYITHLHLDLETLPSWPLIDELRLVANAVKHAEGAATQQLRGRRPELFRDPAFEEMYKEFDAEGIDRTFGTVAAPLSGEEFFVSEKLLDSYAKAAESFFGESQIISRRITKIIIDAQARLRWRCRLASAAFSAVRSA